MNKLLILFSILLSMAMNAHAQRVTDKLDRGVVAVKTTNGVFVSWRIQSDEYYDVTYNLYRNGSLIAENLTTSNYTDVAGVTTNSYTIEAVKHGIKQPQSAAVTPWSNSYLEIIPKHDKSITSTLVPNDACCADVDGDGVLEIFMKYDNQSEINASFPREGHNGEYSIFECLKLDGTVLWWVNCGPNMGDFQNNEQNIVAYDWDLDGKAEAIMRAADGTTIHAADGQTYVIGDASKNYRAATGGGTNWFMHEGAEYLVYMNGTTGVPYVTMDYPLKRLENGETDLNKAWGDGYGHRSSKHFLGAPYLDGRKPSIFLGRGIYTRHKFVAYDVDPQTHQLTERWRWTNNQAGSPWYGQGYHNYAIVDVDWDGRDEIVWGSMVIDDNGKGLSTTGLGHGDAQHHGDFNPYVHGQEGFFCNEDRPSNNYRDLTTSKFYYRSEGGDDDGRAIAGNFLNSIPGAIGFSAHDTPPISLVENKHLDVLNSTAGISQNFRCYWDGDLQEETFNYRNGKNTEGVVLKPGSNISWILAGSLTNNDTKGTPCYQGDLFGDWREEVIMRTGDNKIRIYTTTIETPWRNYSLWYDHQYRNAMVWQMCGYNQPPHTSYFLGELENITVAPPALTMDGRTEIANGGTISNNGEEVITCETNDMTIKITDGATPYIYIDNAPSWVQGSAPSEATAASYTIKYDYYTHTLQGGGFGGSTRVVKQGDGILAYPEKDMTYSGNTDVWAGTLNLNGSIANSMLWLNRLTNLNTAAKDIKVKSLVADYGSSTTIGGENAIGSLTATDSLKMGFGACLKMDLYSNGTRADQIHTAKLIVETKDWKYGPEYKQPVIEFSCHFAEGEEKLATGKYNLGKVGAVTGDVANIKIEGIAKVKTALAIENGRLVLNVEGTRDAADIEWNATQSNVWDVAATENFVTHDAARASESFIEDDNIYFTDNSKSTTVTIPEGVEVKPANIYYTGSKAYTISGGGKIAAGTFYHQGTGSITMKNANTYTGGNHLTGGTTIVSSLSSATQAYGNLGGVNTSANKFTIENGAILQNTSAVTNGSAIRLIGTGIIRTDASFTQQAFVAGDTLVKTGSSSLNMSGNLNVARVIVKAGSMDYSGANNTKSVELQGTATISGLGFAPSPIHVAEGAKATLTLTKNNYVGYSGALTGTGQLTINPTNTVNRVSITGNWTNFKGTIVYNNTSILMPLKNSGMPHATLSTGANTNIGIAASSDNASITYPIGKLIGSGTLRHKEMNFGNQNGVSGNVTWKVGSSDLGDFTFDGVIYDAGSKNKSNFEKVGDCAMTVGGTWKNSGTVTISEGTMILGQGKTLGTGALTVADGATLMGTSSVIRSTSKSHPFTNSSVTIDGTLRVGSDGKSFSGYWYFGAKPLIFGPTSKLYIGVQKCATSESAPGCTHLWGDEANGSITFKDGATISVYLDSTYDPTVSVGTDEAKADSFYVFKFPKTNMGDVKFELPELPEHYYWDTSEFENGYLYIRYSTSVAIMGITSGEKVFVDVFASNGIVVTSYVTTLAEVKAGFYRQTLPKGIYILRMRSEKNTLTSMTLRR
jgi:hypothetical protein